MAIEDLAALRRRLQRALLGVLRRDSPGLALSNLEACLEELESAAEEPAARELWSAAICLVAGLRADSDPPDQASLRLLGQLDRALRTQLQQGEEALAEASFDDLAEAFRKHPRSVGGDAESHSDDVVDDLAGLAAAMNALSQHPAWMKAAGSSAKADNPPKPAVDDAVAEAPDASLTEAPEEREIEVEQDYDANDRVPLTNAQARLSWVVRQAGRDLGRPAELNWRGEVSLPRARLKRLLPHLESVVRNAVYLGVTAPEGQSEGSWPAVNLAARSDGSGAMVEVRTDALAVNLDRLQRRGREAGILTAASVTSAELMSMFLRPGFSTAHKAAQVAGYGVGLDAAYDAVRATGGDLQLDVAADGGLRINIQIPG